MSLGFSVSELITATGELLKIYNGFCSKNGSVKVQLAGLIEHLEHFKSSLEKHKKVLQAKGLRESDYVASAGIKRVLDKCHGFLNSYKTVTEEKRSLKGVYQVVSLVYDPNVINSLHREIERLQATLTLDLALDNALGNSTPHSQPTYSTTSITTSISHEYQIPSKNSPIQRRPVPPNYALEHQRSKYGSQSSSSSDPQEIGPRNQGSTSSVVPRPTFPIPNYTTSPGTFLHGSYGESSIGVGGAPPLTLPPAALNYTIVTIVTSGSPEEFDRKPVVRYHEDGREIVIIDESSNILFSHKIELDMNEILLPYTWHSKFNKRHEPFELTFQGKEKYHAVSVHNRPVSYTIPKYIFTKYQDFKGFQEQISQNTLVDIFEVHKVSSAASAIFKKKVVGDALNEQLKCWKNPNTQRHTISYYANNMNPARHLEFALSGLYHDESAIYEDDELRFTFFDRSSEPMPLQKHARSWSLNLSRASTLVASNTPSSSGRSSTGRSSTGRKPSGASSNTTAGSWSPVGNQSYDLKQGKPKVLSLEEELEYIHIEFDQDTEATRFLTLFKEWRNEEISMSLLPVSEDFAFDKGKSKVPEMERFLAMSPYGNAYSSPQMMPGGYFDVPPEEMGAGR